MPLGIKAIQFSTLKEWAANFSVTAWNNSFLIEKTLLLTHFLQHKKKKKKNSHWSNTFVCGLTQYHQAPSVWGLGNAKVFWEKKKCLRVFLQLGSATSLGTVEIPEGSWFWEVRPRLMQLFTQSLKVNVWAPRESNKRRGRVGWWVFSYSTASLLFYLWASTPGQSSL